MTHPVDLAIAACIIAAGLLAMMLRSTHFTELLDRPNDRSLHVVPVPRIGGIAIMTTLACVWYFAGWQPVAFATAFVLAVVSYVDDRGGLPARVRFGAHLAAAIMFVAVCANTLPVPLALVAVPGIVWMTNLYNFMDGSDGLAGGMATAGFGTYAVIALIQGDAVVATAAFAIVGAAAGFLVFNLHPARVFMGDAGSIPLGFLAATMGVDGWMRDLWPFWVPIVAFGPFVADATVTLLRRAWRRERVWEAHRTHYYQRLVQLGWGHRRTAFAEFALMAASGLLAVAGSVSGTAIQLVILGIVVVAYALIARNVDRAWAAHQRNASGSQAA